MPVAKWIANGVVYKLNREMRENPNYGAPGKDNEPRYIEGDIQSIDVVVRARRSGVDRVRAGQRQGADRPAAGHRARAG